MQFTDNLRNLVTGLGTTSDKRSFTEFTHLELGRTYLGILYRNWLFGKVTDIPADDMTRKWRRPKASSLSIDELEKFKRVERDLKVRASVNEALKWARLYGGAAIIMNVNDGLGELSDPLDVGAIREGDLESLIVVDRWDLTPQGVNTWDVSEGFRLPDIYQLSGGSRVHHSRVIRFDGYKLPWDEFQRNNYWGGSIVERVYDDVLNTKITTQSIASLIFEASVDVITVKDLFNRIMNQKGLDSLIKRFQLANVTKSINKALVIDQDNETFTRHATNFSGLPSLISEFLSVVAAGADIPATRMLGQSAKGFSATGEGDLDNYYDMISSKQETDLYDALTKLDEVLVPSVFGRPVEDWDFEFNPLQQMDEKEISEINKSDTESAKLALESGVITLSQWAAQLLRKGTYPTLDSDWVEALEQMEEEEAEVMAAQLRAASEPTEPEEKSDDVDDDSPSGDESDNGPSGDENGDEGGEDVE